MKHSTPRKIYRNGFMKRINAHEKIKAMKHLTLHNLVSQLYDFFASTLFESMLISPYYNSVQFPIMYVKPKTTLPQSNAPEF
jgi:hypothetical protein